jgi:hypothetical protein
MAIVIGALSSWAEAEQAANHRQRAEQSQKRIQNSFSSLKDLYADVQGINSRDEFVDWLDSPLWEGERTGDVLANIARKNLAGDWLQHNLLSGRHESVRWDPQESFKPLYAGLSDLGYGTADGRDPTALIGYSGGFQTQKDRYGLPTAINTPQGVEAWQGTLGNLSEMFSKINPAWASMDVPMLSLEDQNSRLFGDYRNDPNQAAQLYGKTVRASMDAPPIETDYGYPRAQTALSTLTPEQIEAARLEWEKQQEEVRNTHYWMQMAAQGGAP